MMKLMEDIPREGWTEVPRFDFLQPILDNVVKVVECHANEDDDATYLFIVWLDGNVEPEEAVLKVWEVGEKENQGRDSGTWRVEAFGDMVIVYDEVC